MLLFVSLSQNLASRLLSKTFVYDRGKSNIKLTRTGDFSLKPIFTAITIIH